VNSSQEVREFLSCKDLAIAGLSRDPRGFGNAVFREMTAHGYRLQPVHPQAQTLEGAACAVDFASLSSPVEGAVLILPRDQIDGAVRQAVAAGIRRIWSHQRINESETRAFCRDQGISLIHGHCILMFAQGTGTIHPFHRVHRFVWRVLGKLPREAAGPTGH
jgi:uncharacterized protein